MRFGKDLDDGHSGAAFGDEFCYRAGCIVGEPRGGCRESGAPCDGQGPRETEDTERSVDRAPSRSCPSSSRLAAVEGPPSVPPSCPGEGPPSGGAPEPSEPDDCGYERGVAGRESHARPGLCPCRSGPQRSSERYEAEVPPRPRGRPRLCRLVRPTLSPLVREPVKAVSDGDQPPARHRRVRGRRARAPLAHGPVGTPRARRRGVGVSPPRLAPLAHTVTLGRRESSIRVPIPGTASRASTVAKRPCWFR